MKKRIEKLAQQSYQSGKLDLETVNLISSYLSRKQLKIYIKALKRIEQMQTVNIDVPSDNEELYQLLLKDKFAGKNIIVKHDPELLLGIKIRENDTIYEFSLKNALENIYTHVQETYD